MTAKPSPPTPKPPRPLWLTFSILFILLLILRTLFGLSQPFFTPDELQTYLIGLRCYTDHLWPFFGPDLIVTETGFYTQLPGALEGLLLGLPFYLLPIPEAPFVMVNLLSLSALGLLAWNISRRVSHISFFFIFVWLALLPWNLHESTNPINPSFLLFGSVFFFLGFLEALPETALGWLSPSMAFAWMGFGLFWDMQFHFSWVLLPFFVLAGFLWRRKLGFKGTLGEILGFLGGSLLSGVFLIPTLVTFGWGRSSGGGGLSVAFNPSNLESFATILARYLSLASHELPRFLGTGTHERIGFLLDLWWVIPPALLLLAAGWLEPLILLGVGFFKDPLHKDWKGVSLVCGLGFALVWVSFWFTSKPPSAHIYYLLGPLVSVYSFLVWDRLAAKRPWRLLGKVLLAASLWFQTGYLLHFLPLQSLYLDRPKVESAIHLKNYHLLGERRPGSFN